MRKRIALFIGIIVLVAAANIAWVEDVQQADNNQTQKIDNMKKYGSNGWLFPKPVLIVGTYDKDGNPDAMLCDNGCTWDYTEVVLFLGKQRKTTLNLKETGEFTIGLPNKETMAVSDYVGIISGLRDPDKMKRSGLEPVKAPDVNAPLFTEFPMTLECRVIEMSDATTPSCYHLIGEIVGVLVDNKYVSADGLPDIAKMHLICHENIHQTYIELGEIAGNAFGEGRKLLK